MSRRLGDMRALKGLLHSEGHGRAIPVIVTPYEHRVVVRGAHEVDAVPIRRLRREAAHAAPLVLVRSDKPEWKLIVGDVGPDSWARAIKLRRRLPGRGLALAGGLSLAIVTASWAFREDIIVAAAPLVPHSVADQIGRSYLAEMGRTCDSGPGNVALARLTAKLSPATLPEPLSVKVFDSPEINAIALPGGHVALFRGLIEQARSSDEIAATLAHEIEHVARQHPNQDILRASGPAVVARTLDSDAGKLADLTVLKKGSKAAEAEADTGAIALLGAANISTRGAADFFKRQATPGSIFDTSHPSDASRAALFAGAAKSGTAPALDEAEWQALRLICRE